jgi:hypothetical protein
MAVTYLTFEVLHSWAHSRGQCYKTFSARNLQTFVIS